MLVIMNPPYGKSNSVVKPIVRGILDNLDFTEAVLLCPVLTFNDPEIISHVEFCEVIENPFEDANVIKPCVSLLKKAAVNKFDVEALTLESKELELVAAVKKYNESHESSWLGVAGANLAPKWDKHLSECSDSSFPSVLNPNKVFHECVEDFTIFLKTRWSPFDGVHISESHDWDYNLRNNDRLKRTQRGGDAFVFKDRPSRENFVKWWYSCLDSEDKASGLTNTLLTIIAKCVSDTAGVEAFRIYFPNLDWSRSWDDEEILAELGLRGFKC